MPRLPGESGSPARTFWPDWVRGDGLGKTSAPYSWIIERRYGFWW